MFYRQALGVSGLLVLASGAMGAPVAGPGGHFYDLVVAPEISWEEARAAAAAAVLDGTSGHLATITSREEDLFINAFCSGGAQELWVGGFQARNQQNPGEGWMWVNDEGPVAGYTNWEAPEPNDFPSPESNDENFLAVFHCTRFGWNDEGNPLNIAGYVVEYDITGPAFRRGETTGDGRLNIVDAVNILTHLFTDFGEASCLDSADTDDDGAVTIADAVGLLGYLFRGTLPPSEPFGACGQDPSEDALDCGSVSACE